MIRKTVVDGSVQRTTVVEYAMDGASVARQLYHIIVHFCKFPSLAHNLIHTGYYGTEMQGYWCCRGSLLEWSAVWLIHASWIGASMEDPSLVSFSI